MKRSLPTATAAFQPPPALPSKAVGFYDIEKRAAAGLPKNTT